MLAAAGSGAGCWHYGISSQGDSTAAALYVADSWRATEALRLDAGIRRERQTLDYTLDSGPGYPTGTVNQVVPHVTGSKTSYTGAADYAFTGDTAAYARYTQGYKFPMFDDFRGNGSSAAIQSIKEFEGGYKHTGSVWKLYASAFWNKSDSFAGVVGGVVPAGAFTAEAKGLIFDGSMREGQFSVNANATYQHATYTESVSDPLSVGKKVQRQPDLRVLLSPAFDLPGGEWNTKVYGSLAYIGRRPADADNTFFFDAYTTIDAGVKVKTPWGWDLQVYGQNLGDKHDATEGDPRSAVAANYRPILGRSVQFSVTYPF
jgi:outer membrane receptor protein involved in Fe transport